MAVYKEEKTGTWRAVYRYTDWNGERKQTQKRGFKTKREAQAWEREQIHKTSADLDMNFKSFVELYTADMKTRLKENTWATKEHIIRTKLLPYFGKLKMCNITAQQIITWQNEMMNHKDENGQPYSPVYLKTVHNQLSAIFNHAVRYYNLRDNPCKKAGSMGKKKNREMMFWTKEQYLKFAEVMMDKPLSFYAFEMLYWCGIREGELLALTPADFDFEKRTVTINKSYQRLNGQDLITTPKTEKSNRVITMPQFLAEEIQDYLKMLYGIGADDRMFTVTKSYLHREMDRGSKEAGTVDSSQRPKRTARARRKCLLNWINTTVSIGVCLLLPKATTPLCCTCSPAWMRKTAEWQWCCPMVFCSVEPAREKFAVSWWK